MSVKFFKYYFLLLIVFSGYTPLFSQNFEVAKSDFQYNYGSTSLQKIIGYDSTNYFVLKFEANRYYIEKLDKNLNFVKKEPIKLNEGLKQYYFEDIVHFHGELYIFLTKYRLKDITLYYQKIDKSSLLPSTDYIEITTIKNVKGNWADIHFALSRKETKLLIVSRIKLNWSKVQFNEYYVFSDNMDLLWKQKDLFDFTGQGPRNNQYLVDDYGNVSIASLVKRENIFSIGKLVKNAYTLYRFTDNGANFRKYPITLPDKYIRGLKIVAADDGGLICAGLYSEMFRFGVKGTFFFRIDANNGNIYNNRSVEFTSDLLLKLTTNNEPITGNNELLDYSLNDLVVREDGKVILIAEQFFNQTFDTYNNIIVTCFNEDGQVYWNQVIQKQQGFNVNGINTSVTEPVDYREYIRETGNLFLNNPNYCSYALMAPINKNYIVIFYNDNIKNIDNTGKTKGLSRMKKSYIAAVIIDAYGNLKKEEMIPWKRKALYPLPIRYYDTKYNTTIIPAFRGRKYNYYKIIADF